MLQEELNRFDRTLAILILLQSKKLLKAQDIAERFNVSLRTIYRDIRSLETAGIPIIGEAGVGYSLMDGYRLPPVMFTKEEAASFVAAEKLMQQFTDASLGTYFGAAMNKIKSVLRGQEKEWIAALENQVWAVPRNKPFNQLVPNALEILFNSIAEQKQVTLKYQGFASEEINERTVEPVGVFYESDHWYLLAFCHLRNDYRLFRTDRIQSIVACNASFTRDHKTVDEIRNCNDNRPLQKVVIAIAKDVVRYIDGGKKYYGCIAQEEKNGEIEMTFMTADPMEGLARWYMMFGDCARIIEPESFRIRIKELAEKINKRLHH